MTYSEPNDLKHLRDVRHAAPKEFEAWLNLDKIVAREDGAIPRKYRELIAIAVAVTTQCPYCLDAHTKGAKENGVTEADILVHDETNRSLAFLLGGMTPPEFPVAMGVIYCDPAPSFERLVAAQGEAAKAKIKGKPGDLNALLRSGYTWEVKD